MLIDTIMKYRSIKGLSRYFFMILLKASPKLAVKLLYWVNTGDKLNLESPRNFNEKIQWIKVFWNDERFTKCSDKYTVREYVMNCGYAYILNELYGVFETVDEINFDALPQKFVLKVTNGCGYNIICDDKEKIDINRVKRTLSKWQKEKFGCFTAERQYWSEKPLIVCEKYLEDRKGKLIDFKIFCFHGVPHYIQVDFDRFSHHTRNIYDVEWNILNLELGYPNNNDRHEKPINLSKMLEIATILSQGFYHVRIDLYDLDGTVYFGEMTFTHTAGYKKFNPEKYNQIFGDLIHLPN